MADPIPAHHRSATNLFSDPLDSHPLWFKPASFLSPDFDSESYISELRTFVPFDTLRSELNNYLSSLNHELIDLINRDYTDFVNLSTKLVDVDAAVVRMRAPLVELREKIEQFRGSVDVSLVAIKNGLKQRSEAASARETLELLLDTFHVVSKVEKLIKELPSVPSDWSNGDVNFSDKNSLSNGVSVQPVENGTSVRETQSMLLERIASEMNRLKFYVTHAKDLPFIENMEKRIQNASLLVDASLGHCFVDGLEHRDATAIYNCLRAYAAIDNTKNAEETFRVTVVAPLIQKIIPHGPLVVAAGSSGDGLENDYQLIKECIYKDCKFLLDISSAENSGLHVFDFLANSILKEVLFAIQKGKPGAFSPGRPTEFLKNYKSSLEFLAYLEGYCPSRSAVAKFRSEAIYTEFMKQWNLGVYFSLRFQEIAGSLDSVLTTSSLVPVQSLDPSEANYQDLTLKQSVTLLESLRLCWREDVLVLSCSDKFLRLSLQLLSRYSNWLSSGLTARKNHNTSTGTGREWAVSAVIDDFIFVIHDIRCLEEHVHGDYLQHVVQALSSCSPDVLESVRQSILQSGQSLKSLEPLVIKAVVESLVEKSVEDLRQMKGITATYRMTNKPLPVLKSKKGWKSIVPLHLKGKSSVIRFSLFRKVNSASHGPGKTPVYLNVYDLTPMNGYVYWAGFGIYHSGVEVHGVEYAFGAHDYPTSGVFEVEPRQCPGFKFRKSIFIGTTSLDPVQVREFMECECANYNGDTYHLIAKNCNHFCKDICYKLTGKSIPTWVNRLAKLGSICNCILPEALRISAVRHDPNYEANDSEKKRLRSAFNSLSSISMRQKQLSKSSLFLQSPLRGCLSSKWPSWELSKSINRSFKER